MYTKDEKEKHMNNISSQINMIIFNEMIYYMRRLHSNMENATEASLALLFWRQSDDGIEAKAEQ